MSSGARRRKSGWRKWKGLTSFALAVLLHVVFVALLLVLSFVELKLPHPLKPPPPQQVSMRGISSKQWTQNRTPLSERNAPALPPQQKTPPPPQTHPKGQVVDVAPGNRQEDPNAKYLAESSNKVEREKRAREQSAFYRNAMPQRTDTAARQGEGADDTHAKSGNGGVGADQRQAQQKSSVGAQAHEEVPSTQKRAEVAMKMPSDPHGPGAEVGNREESVETQGNSSRLNIKPGEPGGGRNADPSAGMAGAPGVTSLTPSMAVLDKIVGAAPNDRLKDVDEGEGTYLNTREWKYSSFFNRLKQSVGMHWDPSAYLRQRDPTGNIYGGKDRYTVLDVTLTDRGMVKEISVQKSSGIDFLDMAAIASFEKAQPFPNPPPGLVVNNAVQFTFGFYLEMGGGSRLRMFRQAN